MAEFHVRKDQRSNKGEAIPYRLKGYVITAVNPKDQAKMQAAQPLAKNVDFGRCSPPVVGGKEANYK